MFRLFFLTFHGERRSAHDASEHVSTSAHSTPHPSTSLGAGVAHGHGTPHDAPASMAFVLVVLAIGSIVAGYVGVPHALRGENRIESFLHPSFAVTGEAHEAAGATDAGAGGEHHADTNTELMLMGLSVGIAAAGIGLAWFFWYRDPERAAAMQRRFRSVHGLLLNKYYVDELYEAAVVQPIKAVSTTVLWKGVDASGIDLTVNGVGMAVRGSSSLLRRLQTGSIRTYAASLFLGAVVILGYYLSR
jgi:NADH-quinone oxidoreductase subunit L